MKPDEQQKQWLKEYLQSVLKYHETYEEVYDHILLALAHHPQHLFFENTINTIIADDFGGINGLFKMEQNCRNAVVTEVRKQYRRYFFSWFKFPYVIYSAVVAVIIAYICIRFSYKAIVLPASVWVLGAVMIPGFLYWARKVKISYRSGRPKKFLKDSILAGLVNKPFKVFWWCFFFSLMPPAIQESFRQQTGFDLWKYGVPPMLVILFAAATIHCFSFIKLIKDDFKIRVLR